MNLRSPFGVRGCLLAGALLLLATATATAQVFRFEKGVLRDVTTAWQTVQLSHTYDTMVVVCTPNYSAAQPQAVVRVRNAEGNSFQVRAQNPGDRSAVQIDVHYIVIEAGVYNIPQHGAKLEARRYLATRTDSQGSWVGHSVGYGNTYANPVVLGQVMTFNDARWSTFWCYDGTSRQTPPTRNGLAIGKHVGGDRDRDRAPEELGYIVFEAGLMELDGIRAFANLGPRSVAGMGNNPPYLYYPLFAPAAGGAIATRAGSAANHGAWSVLYGPDPVTSRIIRLANDKDTLRTPHRRLPMEHVGYFIFAADDPAPLPVVAFALTEGEGYESVSPVEIMVRLSALQSTPVTVDYAVTGGSAVSGVDYLLPPGTLVFAPGEDVQTIRLDVIDNSIVDPDRTVEISLSNPVGATLGASQFVYTILNDDLFDLNVMSGQYLGDEEAVQITFYTEEEEGEYDLIFADNGRFGHELRDEWRLAARGTTTTLTDVGSEQHTKPGALPANSLRFYRISRPGHWNGAGERHASKEVYAFAPVQLHPGQNWVALWGEPDRNEAAYILGRFLPAGDIPAESTRITWYDRAEGQFAERQLWLARGAPNRWLYSVGGDGNADRSPLPLEDGFILELPPGVPPTRLPIALRVPTEPVPQLIKGGGAYNLVSLRAPQSAHPSQLGLIEAGFRGGFFPILSDAIWTFDAASQQVREIIWYNTTDQTWRFMSQGFPLVPPDYFKPFQALIIHTRSGGPDFHWNVPLLYPAPTESMNP